MPAPSSPPSGPPPGRASSRASYANPNTRISDAERTEVADRLSLHYSDGRLDQEEFDRRLHQAMSAVTQADLNGLFADLPDATQAGAATTPPRGRARPQTAPPTGELVQRPPRRATSRVLGLLLIILVAVAVSHALTNLLPWAVVAVIVIAVLAFRRPRRRY
jgi:hypothetical protein